MDMVYICEHEFEKEDPNEKGYSLINYDLYARLNLSIRKNIRTNKYELFYITTMPGQKKGEVVFSTMSLQEIVDTANSLENANNTIIKCSTLCPRRKV